MKLWNKIKRNPVVNFFLVAVLTQISADALSGQIDAQNIGGYFVTLFLGIAARQFTVPAVEHEELDKKFSDLNTQVEAENQKNLEMVVKRMNEEIRKAQDFD